MPMELTNLPHHHTGSNTVMPNWIHGSNPPAANEQLPQSIWRNGVVRKLADYIQQLRKIDQQSGKHDVGDKSNLSHKCPRHTERTCNCANNTCADDDIGEQRKAIIRRINQHYDDRSVGQRTEVFGANGCKYCGSKYKCVCLGRSKECGLYEEDGAGKGAAQTTKSS